MRRRNSGFLLLMFLFPACGSREMHIPVPATYSAISQVTIGPKCVRCHSSLGTYSGVQNELVPGNAARSQLYRVVQTGSMPQQSTALSQEEIQAIHDWIQSGAPEN